METKQFVNDAYDGGFKLDHFLEKGDHYFVNNGHEHWIINTHRLLLNPLAWQAVGKTRERDNLVLICSNCGIGNRQLTKRLTDVCMKCGCEMGVLSRVQHDWQHQMHRFIDHLAEGKSIEESLAAIK